MLDTPLIVIPLRSVDAGKSRLSTVLDVATRQALIEAMLADVLHAVTTCGGTDVVIAACGDHAAGLAQRFGVPWVRDEAHAGGLNQALGDVVAAAQKTHADVMIVAADLPRITAADLDAVLSSDAPIVIAPTHDDGTAVLRQRPPAAFALAYGPGSATKHAAYGRAAGLSTHVLHRDGLLYDLDTPEDLFEAHALTGVADTPLGAQTARVLAAISRLDTNAATLWPSNVLRSL